MLSSFGTLTQLIAHSVLWYRVPKKWITFPKTCRCPVSQSEDLEGCIFLIDDYSGGVVCRMNDLRSLESWDRGFESHSRHWCLHCMRLFCVYIVLCVGRGLATGWSPIQGVLPTVFRIKKLKQHPRPKKGACRIIMIIIFLIIMHIKELIYKNKF
jgi:hypothetical protein